MKQTPLKHYRSPKYPELNRENEESVHLLLNKQMPARWKRLAASAAMLCATAGIAETLPPQQADVMAVDAKPAKETAKQKAEMTLAPISPKLIEYGRASFGCVAVAPAVYLSEAEMKEIIDEELAKAGIRLGSGITLKKGGGQGKSIGPEPAESERAFAFPENAEGSLEIAIDWYDPEKKIAVKWLTEDDGLFWGKVASLRRGSSPEEIARHFPFLTQEELKLVAALESSENQFGGNIDLGASAALLAEEVKAFTGGEGITLAIFAPPLKPLSVREFRNLVYSHSNRLDQASIRDYMKQTGRELEPELRAQVKHFVKWLEEQEKEAM